MLIKKRILKDRSFRNLINNKIREASLIETLLNDPSMKSKIQIGFSKSSF